MWEDARNLVETCDSRRSRDRLRPMVNERRVAVETNISDRQAACGIRPITNHWRPSEGIGAVVAGRRERGSAASSRLTAAGAIWSLESSPVVL